MRVSPPLAPSGTSLGVHCVCKVPPTEPTDCRPARVRRSLGFRQQPLCFMSAAPHKGLARAHLPQLAAVGRVLRWLETGQAWSGLASQPRSPSGGCPGLLGCAPGAARAAGRADIARFGGAFFKGRARLRAGGQPRRRGCQLRLLSGAGACRRGGRQLHAGRGRRLKEPEAAQRTAALQLLCPDEAPEARGAEAVAAGEGRPPPAPPHLDQAHRALLATRSAEADSRDMKWTATAAYPFCASLVTNKTLAQQSTLSLHCPCRARWAYLLLELLTQHRAAGHQHQIRALHACRAGPGGRVCVEVGWAAQQARPALWLRGGAGSTQAQQPLLKQPPTFGQDLVRRELAPPQAVSEGPELPQCHQGEGEAQSSRYADDYDVPREAAGRGAVAILPRNKQEPRHAVSSHKGGGRAQ